MWFAYMGFTTTMSLIVGVPIIIFIVKKYFDANENVGGISAIVLALLLAANVLFALFMASRVQSR